MNTAERRKIFLQDKQIRETLELLDVAEYRQVDSIAQENNNIDSLKYLITRLCDQLILLENAF